MTEIVPTLSLILAFILRIGVPIGIMLLLGRLVFKLDQRWQAEASARQISSQELTDLQPILACWEFIDCLPSQRELCPVYGNPNMSCWEQFKSNGTIQSKCQDCTYRETVLTNRESLIVVAGDNYAIPNYP